MEIVSTKLGSRNFSENASLLAQPNNAGFVVGMEWIGTVMSEYDTGKSWKRDGNMKTGPHSFRRVQYMHF